MGRIGLSWTPKTEFETHLRLQVGACAGCFPQVPVPSFGFSFSLFPIPWASHSPDILVLLQQTEEEGAPRRCGGIGATSVHFSIVSSSCSPRGAVFLLTWPCPSHSQQAGPCQEMPPVQHIRHFECRPGIDRGPWVESVLLLQAHVISCACLKHTPRQTGLAAAAGVSRLHARPSSPVLSLARPQFAWQGESSGPVAPCRWGNRSSGPCLGRGCHRLGSVWCLGRGISPPQTSTCASFPVSPDIAGFCEGGSRAVTPGPWAQLPACQWPGTGPGEGLVCGAHDRNAWGLQSLDDTQGELWGGGLEQGEAVREGVVEGGGPRFRWPFLHCIMFWKSRATADQFPLDRCQRGWLLPCPESPGPSRQLAGARASVSHCSWESPQSPMCAEQESWGAAPKEFAWPVLSQQSLWAEGKLSWLSSADLVRGWSCRAEIQRAGACALPADLGTGLLVTVL
nr:uncharacterized protein LOC116820353 [Chelonoidis abingdonii]